ncbi:MAG: metal ABC transporter solute-binding protein, Zn/Mn family [Candidatus Nanopelagicales bacterium]
MRRLITVFVGFILLSACTSSSTSAVRVVVSTNILGDIVSEIVSCGGGSTEVLMPIGASAHDFSVSSQQVVDMTTADLVVLNGLGLESGLKKVIDNVEAEGGRVFEVGEGIEPLEVSSAGVIEEHSHDHEHEHGEFDPHFWLDMGRMAKAALLIGRELSNVTTDPNYEKCAKEVSEKILTKETSLVEKLNQIPEEKRLLVVDHESFNYFAAAYDFEVVGSLIPSISDNAQPSSDELAALISLIQERSIAAIFVGSENTKKLATALTTEIGRPIAVSTLYEGSLGTKESEASTYLKMMEFNVDTIVKALS